MKFKRFKKKIKKIGLMLGLFKKRTLFSSLKRWLKQQKQKHYKVGPCSRKRRLRRSVVIGFVLVFLVGVSAYFLFFSSSEVMAEWWDTNWHYRKAITITNNTSQETDVYVSVTLDTSNTNKFQADCGDLRFTKISGDILPYYIVSGCGSVSTVIYMKFGTFPAGTQIIYYYYGNPLASDGFSVDDFSTQASNYTVGSLGTEEKGPGPVGYWSFDEGYGTTTQDRTSNNNDGTITGATWQTEDMCVSGKCLYFDGDADRITVTSNTGINQEYSEMTVSAWIKPNVLNHGRILRQSSGNKFYYKVNSDGRLTVELYINGVSTGWQYSSGTIDINEWSHVTFTWDGSTGKILHYINGSYDSQNSTDTGTVDYSSNNFYIGYDGTYAFNGFIDEVKIYPYARTADQIKADYNARAGSIGTSARLSNQQSAINNLSSGLVGYWKMDESSGNAVDSSGNGNTGTWNGSGSHYVAGKFGNGGGFNGTDDYVNCGSGDSLDITGEITVVAWVRIPVLWSAMPSTYPGFMGKSGSWIGYSNKGNNKFKFAVYEPDDTPHTIESNSALEIDTWYHYVGVFDGSVQKMYVDGILQTDTETWSGPMKSNSVSVKLGQSDQKFNGSIDEVRIYNRALSAREVKALYEWAPGPVGHWKMDEHSGTNAYDSSGNGNTGTLTGTTWVHGKYGSALNFVGSSDYVNASSTSSLNPGADMTMEAWIYWNGGSGDHNIVTKESAYEFKVNGGYINYATNPWAWRGGTSAQISQGDWHHIAITNDGDGSQKIYVNGVEKYSDVSGGNITSNANAVTIGGRSGGPGSPFNGLIDDVRIYNYARTQKQILEDMNAGRPAQKSPVLYYSFDNDMDSTVYDQSIYGRNGSTTGSFTLSGKFNKAISLTGGQAINVSDISNSNIDFGTKSFTVVGWVYYTSGTYPRTVFPVRKGVCYHAGDIGFEFDHGYNSNGMSSICINDGINMSRGNVNYDSGSGPTDFINSWAHLAVVYDRDQGKAFVYVNGKKQANYLDISLTTGSIDNNASLSIGNVSGWYLDGKLDEVKIYNYALTEDEIKQEYNQGKVSVMGAIGGDGSGSTSSAGTAEYCVPGSSDFCSPPVAEWNFEEHAGTYAYDSSGNGNTGTLTNMEESDWTVGKIGRALDFDGDNDCVALSSETPTGSKTINAWLKISDKGNQTVFGPRVLIARGEDNKVGYYDGTSWLLSDNSLPVDTWVFLTEVFDTSANTVSFYFDGVLDVVRSTSNFSQVASRIGGYNEPGNWPLQGKIDHIQIYDYARTPAQIAWDYNKGKPIAHWRFDEGQGTTIYDSSGNGNNGTLELGSSGQTSVGSVKVDANTAWYNGREGKQNYSLNFDGEDDYVDCGGVDDFKFGSSDFTISTWIKTSGGSQDWAGIIWKGKVSGPTPSYEPSYSFSKSGSSNSYFFNAGHWANRASFGALEDGQWHHLVGVVDSGVSKAYLDGVFKNQSIATDSDYDTELDIGKGVLDREFNGQIDDVRIYNYALTADQVKQVYNFGAARLGTGD